MQTTDFLVGKFHDTDATKRSVLLSNQKDEQDINPSWQKAFLCNAENINMFQ